MDITGSSLEQALQNGGKSNRPLVKGNEDAGYEGASPLANPLSVHVSVLCLYCGPWPRLVRRGLWIFSYVYQPLDAPNGLWEKKFNKVCPCQQNMLEGQGSLLSDSCIKVRLSYIVKCETRFSDCDQVRQTLRRKITRKREKTSRTIANAFEISRSGQKFLFGRPTLLCLSCFWNVAATRGAHKVAEVFWASGFCHLHPHPLRGWKNHVLL